MNVVQPGEAVPVTARWATVPADGHREAVRPVRWEGGVAVATPRRGGAVRADLEEVFRLAYTRVVGVAARALGSRDEAEDVAREVFLKFARTSVPAAAAPGWLSVAAAHAALNHLRSGRRRASREEAVGNGDAVAPDVADTILTLDERRECPRERCDAEANATLPTA